MENKRALMISVVCLLISITLIAAYVRVKRYEMTKEFGDEVNVVVATRDILEYQTIPPDGVKTSMVFKNYKQPQTVQDVNDVVGKATYMPIAKGEQITLTKLVHQDGKPVLDRQVEKKMRATTVLIAAHTGVGRLIRPGNRVDVLTTASYDSGGQTIFEVKTVVQNVLVLATGRNIQNEVPPRVSREVMTAIQSEFERQKRKDLFGSPDVVPNSRISDENYAHVTLQLTPADAEKVLYLTHTFGDRSLYLTLRNGADRTVAGLSTSLLDDILGPDSDYGKSRRKFPEVPPARPKFEDLKGGQPSPVY